MKKIIAMVLTSLMLAAATMPAIAEETTPEFENGTSVSITNDDGTVETYNGNDSTDLTDIPAVEPTAKGVPEQSDAANEHLASAGLLDEDGNIDWEALGMIPTIGDDVEGIASRSAGVDDRSVVSKTTISPYKQVCYILAEFEKDDGTTGNYRGTGVVVGHSAIATVGHVIYSRGTDERKAGFAKKVTIIAGRNGSSSPYGTANKTRLRVSTTYINSGTKSNDWGLIETDVDVSASTGMAGIRSPGYDIVGEDVEIVGFPKEAQNETNSYKMWTVTESVERQSSDGLITVPTYLSGGNSGGPMFIAGTNSICGLARGMNFNTGKCDGIRVNTTLKNLYMEYR